MGTYPDVDEANSTLGDEAAREANRGTEHVGGLVDRQQGCSMIGPSPWHEMGKRHVWVLHGV